jgi:glucose/galactose transporter
MIGIFILVELLFSDTQELTERIQTMTGAELAAELDILAERVITPYIVMAIVLAAFSVVILKVHLPEVNPEEDATMAAEDSRGKRSVFEFPHLILGVICIFVYVGVEVIAIDTIGLYGQYMGFDLATASKFGIYSLLALVAGYLIGVAVMPKYLSQRNALAVCAALGFVFTVLALITSGGTSIAFIVLLSFAHALMWPCIWPLAIEKLGRFTKIASALLIMGIAGGAILPLVYGALADMGNRQSAYWICLPLYIYILFFALKGYRVGRDKLVPESVKSV